MEKFILGEDWFLRFYTKNSRKLNKFSINQGDLFPSSPLDTHLLENRKKLRTAIWKYKLLNFSSACSISPSTLPKYEFPSIISHSNSNKQNISSPNINFKTASKKKIISLRLKHHLLENPWRYIHTCEIRLITFQFLFLLQFNA